MTRYGIAFIPLFASAIALAGVGAAYVAKVPSLSPQESPKYESARSSTPLEPPLPTSKPAIDSRWDAGIDWQTGDCLVCVVAFDPRLDSQGTTAEGIDTITARYRGRLAGGKIIQIGPKGNAAWSPDSNDYWTVERFDGAIDSLRDVMRSVQAARKGKPFATAVMFLSASAPGKPAVVSPLPARLIWFRGRIDRGGTHDWLNELFQDGVTYNDPPEPLPTFEKWIASQPEGTRP